MKETEDIKPQCCWCDSPLVLAEETDAFGQKLAWCRDSEPCREKQRQCGICVEKDGQDRWLFLPSPRQCDCMMCDAPNLFVYGNRGGGKSVAIRWLCHQLAVAVPGFKYAILRTSFPELMKNHLIFLDNEMHELGGERHGFTYHKTDHVCYYPKGSIGFYAQCANDADVKKILGAEVALVVFDEAPTFQWEHMRLIAASIRVPEGSGLIPMTRYLGNPIGESIDELWKYFIDKDVDLHLDSEYRVEDWQAIEMRIQDNPHLNAKQYWKQFSGLPKHFIKAWKEGIRVEEDTLFEFLPTKDGRPWHVIRQIPRFTDGQPLFRFNRATRRYEFPDWVKIYRAYDHGFWPDPAVCVWFAVYGKRILCFKEMTWYRKLAPAIAQDILDESKGMHVTATYCDPSIDIEDGSDVLSIKSKMEAKGLALDNAINDREIFADAIHSLLDEQVGPNVPRIQFLEGATPMSIKYLPRMKFNDRNPAAMADHKMDHWPVAIAYFGMMNIPTTAPGKSNKPRRWMVKKKQRGSNAERVMQRLVARASRM